ncbi:hypothetical protein [Kitasatospora griseola]|uniref:hypothetical protein n=1 Tax=Kitasatospora griseola TaxID=2064 RepID=UPI0038215F41
MSTTKENDQKLWQSVFTTAGGWSKAVALPDQQSASGPALAEVGGVVQCAHRGAETNGEALLPVNLTTYAPAQAGAWTPDTTAGGGAASWEAPALANADGTLVMVTTEGDSPEGHTPLVEYRLEPFRGQLTWKPQGTVMTNSGTRVAPAMAVLDGKVHLVYEDGELGYVGHLVYEGPGSWTRATGPDGKPTTTPGLRQIAKFGSRFRFRPMQRTSNIALAVHEGQLHMVLRTSRDSLELFHYVLDGGTWTGTDEPMSRPAPPADDLDAEQWQTSSQSAALASYDGKLHAVYPSAEGTDNLRHSTWTQAGGWTEPTDLVGHQSKHTPALLTFQDGPTGAQREALLLVHRGVQPS